MRPVVMNLLGALTHPRGCKTLLGCSVGELSGAVKPLGGQQMPRYPPDRWEDYTPLGVPVKGTRLLPIRLPIPLDKSRYIPPHQRFSFDDLFAHVRRYGQSICCIIDLTFTKYYDPRILHSTGVRYHKIYVEGHQVPDPKHVDEFVRVIQSERERSSDGLIAIHCTHGVNRTGYLVCRYLIDVLKMDPVDALRGKLFFYL
ncbi:RNA/RNP complex-1-interacting phosphatase [Clonorchis sinensis]|uniref:RNA/RNP complex-1-interacting phosphatase n=1 Tax=Clonorchis sinensis TaxID=79923 RepID=A0A8T1MDM1_CLOSI|nr:RNA/RNP complex-1-interacting phosphatase [Clonorchis sinensis]